MVSENFTNFSMQIKLCRPCGVLHFSISKHLITFYALPKIPKGWERAGQKDYILEGQIEFLGDTDWDRVYAG